MAQVLGMVRTLSSRSPSSHIISSDSGSGSSTIPGKSGMLIRLALDIVLTLTPQKECHIGIGHY